MSRIKIIAIAASLVALCSGAPAGADPAEVFKALFAVSTRELEKSKRDALVKVFDCDYKTCYDKTLAIVKMMPDTDIYLQKKDLIAVYCVSLNSTPAGIFFEEVDATRTKVLISSASSSAKEWVASNVFSGKVQKPLVKLKIK